MKHNKKILEVKENYASYTKIIYSFVLIYHIIKLKNIFGLDSS